MRHAKPVHHLRTHRHPHGGPARRDLQHFDAEPFAEGIPCHHAANDALGAQILDRIVAMLINEAADAVLLRIASAEDIDLAMTKGVNYPKGLLAWADAIGIPTVYDRLAALQDEYGEDRYRPSALLKRMARDSTRFYP